MAERQQTASLFRSIYACNAGDGEDIPFFEGGGADCLVDLRVGEAKHTGCGGEAGGGGFSGWEVNHVDFGVRVEVGEFGGSRGLVVVGGVLRVGRLAFEACGTETKLLRARGW